MFSAICIMLHPYNLNDTKRVMERICNNVELYGGQHGVVDKIKERRFNVVDIACSPQILLSSGNLQKEEPEGGTEGAPMWAW